MSDAALVRLTTESQHAASYDESRPARDLEVVTLLERVAYYALTQAGQARILSLVPCADPESATVRMRCVEQTLSLRDQAESIPLGPFPPAREGLDRVVRGASATGEQLRDLGQVLSRTKVLRGFAERQRAARPELASTLQSDPSLDGLLSMLTESIADDGSLKDEASRELGEARHAVKRTTKAVRERLERLLSHHADLLQGQYYAERDGHWVIPLRADAHRSLPGIVWDTSSSGNTLYVEPLEIAELVRSVNLARGRVAIEEQRILCQLSDAVRTRAEESYRAIQICEEADCLRALDAWAHENRAVAILPSAEPVIELHEARHPLLVGQGPVVANDLTLLPGQALILSGPNAGGKSVALKCLGLCAWMVAAGIPLPVGDETRMGFFPRLLSAIGDSQNLLSNLSTFSGHVVDLSHMLSAAGPGTLILVDEIMAGTDPEEGSALAAALLHAWVERGASVAVTTHYESLKELAAEDPRFCNAAVGFDLTTLLPTYRILLGVAGPSTALDVAARYGLPRELVERARERISEPTRERERVLRELLLHKNAAVALREEAEKELSTQRALRQALEENRTELEQKQNKQLELEYRELLGAVRQARSELYRLEKALHIEGVDAQRLREQQRVVDQVAHVTAHDGSVARAVHKAPALPVGLHPATLPELAVGQRVHVPRLQADAEVVSISSKGRVKVARGALQFQVLPSELMILPGTRRAQAKPARPRRVESEVPNTPAPVPLGLRARMSTNSLDLRGWRVAEALDELDRFVDEMLHLNEPVGFVLHGHGTGALKQAVRQHLAAHSQVRDATPAAPEDGGDAFTMFELGRT